MMVSSAVMTAMPSLVLQWALPTYVWGIQWVVAPESNAPLRGPPKVTFDARFAWAGTLPIEVEAGSRRLPVRAYAGVRV